MCVCAPEGLPVYFLINFLSNKPVQKPADRSDKNESLRNEGFVFSFRAFVSDNMSITAVDYLGSRSAGLLIAAQKLMWEEKKEGTQKREKKEKKERTISKKN